MYFLLDAIKYETDNKTKSKAGNQKVSLIALRKQIGVNIKTLVKYLKTERKKQIKSVIDAF